MSRVISLIVLLACIVIIGLLFYKVMIGFLIPLFLAAVLTVIFRPLHLHVLRLCNNKTSIAATITTLIVALLVLVPAGLGGTFAAIQAIALARNINPASMRLAITNARDAASLQAPEIDRIRAIDRAIAVIQDEVNKGTIASIENPVGPVADYEKTAIENIIGLKRDYLLGLTKKSEEDFKAFTERVRDPSEQAKYRDDMKAAIEAQDRYIDWYFSGRSPDATNPVKPPVLPAGSNFVWPTDLSGVERIANQDVLDGIKTLLIDLDRVTPTNDPNDPGIKVDLGELQARAVVLNAQWQRQRANLLGGTVRGFFREVANPTTEQVENFMERVSSSLQQLLLKLTGQTGAFLIRLTIGLAIMMVSLFFFLYDGPAMIKALMKLSPLDDKYEMELLGEFDRIVRAIVLALISSAIVQGLTAGIGYYATGMPWLVLTLITMLCALIPFVGPAIVWVPVCLYLAAFEGRIPAAGMLAAWGLLAVGSVDNVVKTLVLHGQSSLHPLLALLSILGGVQALGPIGLVVGPITVTLLQTLLKILQREMNAIDQPEGVADIAAEASTSGTIAVSADKSGFGSMLDRLRSRAAAFREKQARESTDE
jgi:predicted PurR-regulated permease PerM